MVIISDNFETGQSKTTRIEDLPDEALKKIVATGNKDAIREYAERIKRRRGQ